MLSRLSIQNYAIIEELNIEFSSDLNVITGETGAGKSIIVGALGLILGQRAESNVLLEKQKKCIVEGTFTSEKDNEAITAFLHEHELDLLDEIVVRREISPNGKSRSFINDTPVTLSQLSNLSSLLVDLHQQFDTLEIAEAGFQKQVLDALADNFSNVKKYKNLFHQMQAAKKKLEQLQEQKAVFNKEYDYFNFQFTELEEALFKDNELEDLEQEIKLLSNAEEVKATLTQVYRDLDESELPVTVQVKQMAGRLHHFINLHPDIPALAERLQSAFIELQDIAGEIENISNSISADAGRTEWINERLSFGYKLLKKHGVTATADLIRIHQELSGKLQEVLNIDDAILKAEHEFNSLHEKANKLADTISAARKKQVTPFEQKVNKLLVQVGMPNAKLKVDVTQLPALHESGKDNVVFLFDANNTRQFQPVGKVASGGELSRLMLSIKSLVATSIDLPTLIFDEVDTGISGEAARQVGIIMKDLSASRQIICITHQPQIAGKAHTHFFVYKAVENDKVKTRLKLLDKDERIISIAKMLSGEKPTAAALENAREMIMN